ncbi:MAG TPA: hypothetical protein VGR72_01205 [Candidatus Acidoferrales bacterium]|nr:hypothetical protein [Candidatus Acidoferrales bacterium]
MPSSLWLLWILTGGAVASWVMIHIWLPDPPPNIAGKFIGMLIAGVTGGVLGGFLMRSISADPVPQPWMSFVGVVTVALIVSVGVAVLGRIGAGSTR